MLNPKREKKSFCENKVIKREKDLNKNNISCLKKNNDESDKNVLHYFKPFQYFNVYSQIRNYDGALGRTKFFRQSDELGSCSTISSKHSSAATIGFSDPGLSFRLLSPFLKPLNQFCGSRSLTVPETYSSLISFVVALEHSSFFYR